MQAGEREQMRSMELRAAGRATAGAQRGTPFLLCNRNQIWNPALYRILALGHGDLALYRILALALLQGENLALLVIPPNCALFPCRRLTHRALFCEVNEALFCEGNNAL